MRRRGFRRGRRRSGGVLAASRLGGSMPLALALGIVEALGLLLDRARGQPANQRGDIGGAVGGIERALHRDGEAGTWTGRRAAALGPGQGDPHVDLIVGERQRQRSRDIGVLGGRDRYCEPSATTVWRGGKRQAQPPLSKPALAIWWPVRDCPRGRDHAPMP